MIKQFALHPTEADIIFISLVITSSFSCTISIRLKAKLLYVLNVSQWTTTGEQLVRGDLRPKHILGGTGMEEFIQSIKTESRRKELN